MRTGSTAQGDFVVRTAVCMSEFFCAKLFGVTARVILSIAHILWYVELYCDVAVTSKGYLMQTCVQQSFLANVNVQICHVAQKQTVCIDTQQWLDTLQLYLVYAN